MPLEGFTCDIFLTSIAHTHTNPHRHTQTIFVTLSDTAEGRRETLCGFGAFRRPPVEGPPDLVSFERLVQVEQPTACRQAEALSGGDGEVKGQTD